MAHGAAQSTKSQQTQQDRQTISQLINYAQQLRTRGENQRALGFFRALAELQSSYQKSCRVEWATLLGLVGNLEESLAELQAISKGPQEPIRSDGEARLQIQVAILLNTVGGKPEVVEQIMQPVVAFFNNNGDSAQEGLAIEAKIVAAIDHGDLAEAQERYDRVKDHFTPQGLAITPQEARQPMPQPATV